VRIGLISAATYRYRKEPRRPGSHHGTAFASTFNGFDESEVRKYDWTFVRARKRIEGARVVKIWDQERVWAQRLAAACDIPTVCRTPEECSAGVDLAILVDDGSGEHSKYAIHPLRAGVPTFCDKPLAMNACGAKAVADLARETGTPFMSASSLRFVPDILRLRAQLPELGPVYLAQAVCANELIYYGIHALSMVYAVLGGGAVSAVNVGQPGLNVVRIRFADHRDVVLMVGERQWMRSGYQISLFGKQGWRTVKPDLSDLYWYLLKAVLDYVRTGEESVPIEEEVEVIAALEAGKRSLAGQEEVTLESLFA
jgi:hypothetical protein